MKRTSWLFGKIPDGVPLQELEELERAVKDAGYLVGVGGYDRVLLDEAERAQARATAAFHDGENRSEAGASASAILCSAAACEARLSEYLAHWEFASGDLPDELEKLRTMRNPHEQWKHLLGYVTAELDLGERIEFQRLGCLFVLRHHVAHRHARLSKLDSFPERLEPCVTQGMIPVRDAENVDWTSVTFVHEVALWAFETARDWIALADEVAPLRC